MTPANPDALADALARTMWGQSFGTLQDASWDVALQIAKHIPDGQAASCLMTVRSKAADIVAEHFAPLLADLQRVTAERDEARADQKAAEDSNDALNEKLHALAPHGSCACSYDKPGDVCMHHSPALAAAEARAAQLQAEVAARQAEDEALMLSNDGELEADPQKQIAHLQLSCREFIREREEWKASAKREWATADRLRAEGEAKDRALKAATDKLEAVCSAISVAAEWERAAERLAQREDERLRRNPLIRGAVEAACAATAREG